jgi:hypothetical protein
MKLNPRSQQQKPPRRKLVSGVFSFILAIASAARGAGLMLLLAGIGYMVFGKGGAELGGKIGLVVTIIAVVMTVIMEMIDACRKTRSEDWYDDDLYPDAN